MVYAFRGVENLFKQLRQKTTRRANASLSKRIGSEVIKGKRLFSELALRSDDSLGLKRIVHYHQQQLLTFANKTFGNDQEFRREKASVVGSLLQFLFNTYPEHFDVLMALPDVIIEDIARNVAKCNQTLHESGFFSKMDPRLARLTQLQLDAFLTNSHWSTFKYAWSTSDLCERLQARAYYGDDSNAVNELLVLDFIELDFESQQVFRSVSQVLSEVLQKLDSDYDRLNLAALYLKRVSQAHPVFPRTSGSATLKDFLTEWLTNEIQYLERDQVMQKFLTNTQQPGSAQTFKVTVDLSVAQMAFILRAFVESGVIQNKNTTEMMSFLSKFVKTKRSGNISQESLRIKYYDVESGTKESVRVLLHNAIGYINKY